MKYRSRGATSVAVLACLTLTGAGCAAFDADNAPAVDTVEQQFGPATPGEQHNGKWYLSELLDQAPYTNGGGYFSVAEGGTKDGLPAGVKFAGVASLAANGRRGTDPWFDNVILSSGTGIDLRLKVVAGTDQITHYKLESRTAPVLPFKTLCADAIPLKGTIAADTEHLGTPGRITFACSDGAGAKCVDFGYGPGGTAGTPLWNAHEACTSMVRAAYCRSGSSHTYNGTRIKFVDNVGIYSPDGVDVVTPIGSWPPDPSTFRFEAAWTGDNAGPVDCVGRVRWTSEKIGGLCAEGELPDPRVDDTADSCDGMDPLDMLDAGALIISAVQANELGLHRWRREMAGGEHDFVTTILGYHDATDRVAIRPFPAYGTYIHDDFDGRDGLEGFLLRAIPDPVPDNPTVEVSIYGETSAKGTRFVLARTNEPEFIGKPGITSAGEGYVFEDPGAGLIELALWKNPTTGDYVSTTRPQPLPGYTVRISSIGYIRAPKP